MVMIVGLVVVAGCGQQPRSAQTPEQRKWRLDAAIGVTNMTQKNEALISVAEDAADAGAGDIVVKALEEMSNLTTKSDVAETCALKLARRGDAKAATRVAETMTNLTKKNEVLARIAKGNP
jgi:hypothetical protein